MKFIMILIAVILTAIFLNYKISKSVRVIAFQEEETPTERIVSFVLLIIICIFWVSYFYFFE